jgi:hypothetical protein
MLRGVNGKTCTTRTNTMSAYEKGCDIERLTIIECNLQTDGHAVNL